MSPVPAIDSTPPGTRVPDTAAGRLRCFVPRPAAPYRLVCLPHAGGAATFFRDWGTGLPDVEVYAACYPGRGERIDEPPPADLRLLAREIADAVAPLADRPLALFGHSMGAPVALETARLLEASGVPVAHLFASGSRDGECPPPGPVDPADEDPDTLIRNLVSLGGTDPAMADDPDFRELVLPYVVGDGRMFHAYAMDPLPPLRCPVTTIVGRSDTDADRRPWSRLTTGALRPVTVPGDHFYLLGNPPYDLVQQSLAERTV